MYPWPHVNMYIGTNNKSMRGITCPIYLATIVFFLNFIILIISIYCGYIGAYAIFPPPIIFFFQNENLRT